MKKNATVFLFLFNLILLFSNFTLAQNQLKIIDQRDKKPAVHRKILIDKVWSGHLVGFYLSTEPPYQYVAYYDRNRRMNVAMRNLADDEFKIYRLPSESNRPPEYKANQTSTILGWDSHNYITMELDKNGFIHLSGNMHCNKLTYFRSSKPYDITTLRQVHQMVGKLEHACTYPEFMKGPDKKLIFHYRYGKSGDGNEIYNIYDTDKQKWSRLLEKPLTDGLGQMNAYIIGPLKGPDNCFHVSWVWRNTPDCKTNHDLSYMKTPDLKNWYSASGHKLKLPVTIKTKSVIVDPIPVEGGIINGSGKIGFDSNDQPVLSYHKFDPNGNTQVYCAVFKNDKWNIHKITDWNYRWFFTGGGSIEKEIRIGRIIARKDNLMELSYQHKKYGKGTWLIDKNFEIVAKILKNPKLPRQFNKPESNFDRMKVRTRSDSGSYNNPDKKYYLKWESLGHNRDRPIEGEIPPPSNLYLYEIVFE